MKGGFVIYNGRFYRENEPIFYGTDLFRLNSGIRESFRAENNRVIFSTDNFHYLVNALLSVGIPLPGELDFGRFTRDVSRLLNKNHFFLAARVIIQFIPGHAGTDYLLTAEEVPSGFYPLSDNVLLVGFYEEGIKVPSVAHSYEPPSRFLWAAATRAASQTAKNSLIILNNRGYACESICGTFGYLLGKSVVFPSPSALGYCPPILGVIMECAEQCGFNIIEKDDISREDLLGADELFLIDNCLGLQPVLGLNSRRYYNSGSRSIALKLSEVAKSDIAD